MVALGQRNFPTWAWAGVGGWSQTLAAAFCSPQPPCSTSPWRVVLLAAQCSKPNLYPKAALSPRQQGAASVHLPAKCEKTSGLCPGPSEDSTAPSMVGCEAGGGGSRGRWERGPRPPAEAWGIGRSEPKPARAWVRSPTGPQGSQCPLGNLHPVVATTAQPSRLSWSCRPCQPC